MATIDPGVIRRNGYDVVTWAGMSTADTGTAYRPQGRVRHIAGQADDTGGAWGSATLIMQGSNDGTNYVALNDLGGDAISLTEDGGFSVGEAHRELRPSMSGGTGDNVNVTLTVRYDP